MKMRISLVVAITGIALLMAGCVSQSDLDELETQNKELQKQIEELQTKNIELQSKNDELSALNSTLVEANKKLLKNTDDEVEADDNAGNEEGIEDVGREFGKQLAEQLVESMETSIEEAVVTATESKNNNADDKGVVYANENDFEAALNSGTDCTGATVTFIAGELQPDSAYGYNIWSGQHLNFVSATNPNVAKGDVVTVKVTNVISTLGSWIIYYSK